MIDKKSTYTSARTHKTRLLPLLAVWAIATVSTAAAQTHSFEVSSGEATETLNEFAQQAQVSVVYRADKVAGYETNAVDGSYAPREALELMLADTGLRLVEGRGTAFAVQARAEDTGEDIPLGNARTAPKPVLMAQNRTSVEQSPSSRTDRTEGDDDETVSQQLEEIVVTGSRIRGAQSASPVVTIDRAEIDMAGFATVEEVVENLPQNFGAGATSDFDLSNVNRGDIIGGAVADIAGGRSVNLRGLGTSSTLVLLNGRRMSPSGLRAGFTNIGSIPVTAIERVEVLTDGASAIYGSDAIAGVINFILRENYDGAETRLRYGADARGDTSDMQFGQTFGTSWNSGSVLLSYEYFDRDALASNDREFTASSDLTPFGGTDWRRAGGSPANIIAGGQSFAIPDGQDGTALTSADFVGLENTENVFNERELIDLTPSEERHSGFLHVTQKVGAVELFGAVHASRQETERMSNLAALVNFTLTDASPHFVDPTGTGLTQVSVRSYSLTDEAGPEISSGEIDTFGASLGAQVEFAGNWSGELSLDWSREEALSSVKNRLNTFSGRAALAATLNLTDPTLAFNPFSDGSNANNRAILEQLLTPFEPLNSYETDFRSAGLDIDGNLFELGGGAAKLAGGVNFRRESLNSVEDITRRMTEEDLSRDVSAAYAELYLPLVGRANGRLGIRRLEVSFAVRHEDFSDFGGSTNPKLGVLWSPESSLIVRGTIGTSFRAPSLFSLNGSRARIFFLPDGRFGPPAILATGNNAGLKAEESTTWTAGIQWTPKTIDGLSLDLTYFNVDFTDRIEVPLFNSVLALADPASFPSIVTPSPTTEQIAAFVDLPGFQEGRFAPGSPEDFISGAIPVEFIVDNRLTNLADSLVTGVELQLSYSADTQLGTIAAGFNGSYMLDFKRRILPTDPLVDEVDTYGRPVDFRARGSLSWRRNSWSIAGFVNYTDGYTDSISGPARPDDPRAVDSWTTVDFTVAYETGSGSGLLNDIRVSLTTQNLFDEDPPFVDTRGGIGYDAVNANPLGRFFAFQLTKDW